jgi:hypothetical protein
LLAKEEVQLHGREIAQLWTKIIQPLTWDAHRDVMMDMGQLLTEMAQFLTEIAQFLTEIALLGREKFSCMGGR